MKLEREREEDIIYNNDDTSMLQCPEQPQDSGSFAKVNLFGPASTILQAKPLRPSQKVLPLYQNLRYPFHTLFYTHIHTNTPLKYPSGGTIYAPGTRRPGGPPAPPASLAASLGYFSVTWTCVLVASA